MKGVLKGNSCESSERKQENQRKSPPSSQRMHNNHEQYVGRNVGGKGHSDEVSDRHITKHQSKGNPVIQQQRTWLNCVPVLVLWKVEFVSNETGYLVLEISKQSVEAVAQFFLTAYSKIGEERNELKKEL